MRILGFGTYDVSTHPRVGVLLAGLAEHGHQVVELNRPLGIGTAGRVQALKSPAAALRFALRLLSCWASLIWGARRFRGRNAPGAILVGYLGHFDVILARLLFPRRTIMLDHLIFAADTAADRRLDGGIKTRLLRALDRLALRSADVIILDTPEHETLVPEELRDRVVVVPVGAPGSWFAARRERSLTATAPHPPSVVFFGLFTPLQGTPTIARALRILDDEGVACEVTLIGSGQDEAECREILASLSGIVRVTWRDWVPGSELPSVVASHDICLGIFGVSPKAQRVVPNKAYQGMAAGCALITSDTPSQRAMLPGAHLVPAGDERALAAELRLLLTDGRALDRARRAAATRADEAFGPDAVTAALEGVLA
ncbi:glycosyltransferase [Actinomycetaceae bacterium L2_0104]